MNRCLAVDQEIEGDVVKRAGTQTRDHGGLQMHHDLLGWCAADWRTPANTGCGIRRGRLCRLWEPDNPAKT